MTKSILLVVWEWMTGLEERSAKGHKETFVRNRNVHIVIAMVVSQVYENVKTYCIMHLKYVQFIACQLSLNKVLKNKM